MMKMNTKKRYIKEGYIWSHVPVEGKKKEIKKTRNFYHDVYPLVAFMSECKMIGE